MTQIGIHLGCGAPILPSVGLVDAMRVGPDIDRRFEPPDGDQSRPSQRAAALSVVGRAWQHGRFWANDPDCLLLSPGVQQRERWARTVERYGGLRGSSDRIGDLDAWGLATTRRLLARRRRRSRSDRRRRPRDEGCVGMPALMDSGALPIVSA